MKRILAAALFVLPALSQGATATFQNGVNGYAGEVDGNIDSFNSSFNFSGNSILTSGVTSTVVIRGLIRFDVASLIGQYSDVSSITLTVSRNTDFGSHGANTLNLHEVNAANSDWGYDTFTWDTKNGITAWDGGGGLGATGYSPTLASQSWTTTSGTLSFTITGLAAKNLVDDFTTGNDEGFLLNSTNETTGDNYIVLTSGLNDTISARPTLSITYTPVPEPSSAFLLLGSLVVVSQRRQRRK